jgi:hypothetical protein
MIEPRCLIVTVDSGSWFQAGFTPPETDFVGSPNGFVAKGSAGPWLAAGQTFVQRIGLLGGQSVGGGANDRKDFLHQDVARASGSRAKQILHGGADLRLGVIRARKFPIFLI